MPEDRSPYASILEKSKAAMDIEAGLRVAFPGCPIQVDLIDDEDGGETLYSVEWTDGPSAAEVGAAVWGILHGVSAGEKCRFAYGRRHSEGGVRSESGQLPVRPPGNVVPIGRGKRP